MTRSSHNIPDWIICSHFVGENVGKFLKGWDETRPFSFLRPKQAKKQLKTRVFTISFVRGNVHTNQDIGCDM
jgi:hypothetical protein